MNQPEDDEWLAQPASAPVGASATSSPSHTPGLEVCLILLAEQIEKQASAISHLCRVIEGLTKTNQAVLEALIDSGADDGDTGGYVSLDQPKRTM